MATTQARTAFRKGRRGENERKEGNTGAKCVFKMFIEKKIKQMWQNATN